MSIFAHDEPGTVTIPLRELNQPSRIAERVESGQVVVVTKNGHPIMRIEPYGQVHAPVYPFRTDPMGDELDDTPEFTGPADLSTNPRYLEGFGE
jgi:antitoxin (DNA-binding transcriptional repressor) of toxin-antitoxin stability system